MMTIKELAEVYYYQFDRGTRPSGREYFFPSQDSDGSLQKLIDYATAEVDLDDTSFEFVNNALIAIDGYDNTDRIELGIIATHLDLMTWLTDNYERSLQVEDVVNEGIREGKPYKFDLFDAMLTAYTLEAYDVLYAVIKYLTEQVDIVNKLYE